MITTPIMIINIKSFLSSPLRELTHFSMPFDFSSPSRSFGTTTTLVVPFSFSTIIVSLVESVTFSCSIATA